MIGMPNCIATKEFFQIRKTTFKMRSSSLNSTLSKPQERKECNAKVIAV
jgi:hypothetical protein